GGDMVAGSLQMLMVGEYGNTKGADISQRVVGDQHFATAGRNAHAEDAIVDQVLIDRAFAGRKAYAEDVIAERVARDEASAIAQRNACAEIMDVVAVADGADKYRAAIHVS